MREWLADIWKSIRKDRGAMIGLGLILVVTLMAVCAPLAPHAPKYSDPDDMRDHPLPPSGENWLGTDKEGFDVFSRLMWGAQLSLITGLSAIALALAVGVPMGALSGYAGGKVDSFFMRSVDIMLAFPSIVLAIAIATLFKMQTVLPIIVAVGIVNVPTIARQVRASVLQAKTQEYVVAARSMGFSPVRILFRHVLPNCMAPIIVVATLGIGWAILSAAGLNFLGLGPPEDEAEWGVMLQAGFKYIDSGKQWLLVPAGAAIAVTVLGFNLVGDGLRKALDPRAR
jgi:peptide/nickel transport system permease protein